MPLVVLYAHMVNYIGWHCCAHFFVCRCHAVDVGVDVDIHLDVESKI